MGSANILEPGDINGDGKDDLVMGADNVSPTSGLQYAGTVYVLFGQDHVWPASFNLTTLNGSNGFFIDGLHAADQFGSSVSTAGDINGDGKADLVMGAYDVSPYGAVYVLFGKSSGWSASFNLGAMTGINGFTINGLHTGDQLGYSVSTAGDINGDGLDDLVLGANSASPGGVTSAGTVYVLFGQKSGWSSSYTGDQLGYSVSTAGDMNGDDKDDLVLGALVLPLVESPLLALFMYCSVRIVVSPPILI